MVSYSVICKEVFPKAEIASRLKRHQGAVRWGDQPVEEAGNTEIMPAAGGNVTAYRPPCLPTRMSSN